MDAGGVMGSPLGLVACCDAQATRRRRRFSCGRQVFVRAHQLDAAELLDDHLEALVTMLQRHRVGVVEVRHNVVRCPPPPYEHD